MVDDNLAQIVQDYLNDKITVEYTTGNYWRYCTKDTPSKGLSDWFPFAPNKENL